jgi:hypothetical protein
LDHLEVAVAILGHLPTRYGRIAGTPAEIPAEHVADTSVEGCRYSSPVSSSQCNILFGAVYPELPIPTYVGETVGRRI